MLSDMNKKKQTITYQQKRSFDVMESAASNESGTHNEFMGMGMGLAMGNKMGAVVGTQMGNMAAVMDVSENDKPVSSVKKCINCNSEISINSKFCPECGSPQQIKCPKCNSEIQGNPKFCPECGNKL